MSGGLFGNLFDFNKNGNIDMFERIVELETFEKIMNDEDNQDNQDDQGDEDDE